MRRADREAQLFVLALTLARAPGIETGSRDSIEPTHQRDAVLSPVYFVATVTA
jgi:hypothetical protein